MSLGFIEGLKGYLPLSLCSLFKACDLKFANVNFIDLGLKKILKRNITNYTPKVWG